MTTHLSRGALMSLVAYVTINMFFIYRRKNFYYEKTSCIKFYNNKLTIKREGDTCVPLYIKSDKEIKNIKLKIGGLIINKIPLEFCNKLYGHKIKKDNYFLYKIPWNLIFEKDLYIIKLKLSNIDIIIESDYICNAELYLKIDIYYQSRRDLVNTN